MATMSFKNSGAAAMSSALDEATIRRPGRLAQLGEHQLDKLGVTGSSPVPPTSEAPAQRGFSFSRTENATGRVAAKNGRTRERIEGGAGSKAAASSHGPQLSAGPRG